MYDSFVSEISRDEVIRELKKFPNGVTMRVMVDTIAYGQWGSPMHRKLEDILDILEEEGKILSNFGEYDGHETHCYTWRG